jgi:hypothetical protein
MMVILPVLLASCAPRDPAPLAPMDAERLRGEAILALQDDDGPPLLDEADVSAVAAGLRAIHAVFPEVRDVGGYGLPGTVAITLADSLSRWIAARVGVTTGEGSIERTGVAGLDSVSAMLGVESLGFVPEFDLLRARSPRAVNAPAAGRLYGRVPGVKHAGPLILIGQGNAISARLEGGRIRYAFSRGWGDCMSGCLYHHAWTFEYDPRTGRVRKTGESGAPLPPPVTDGG